MKHITLLLLFICCMASAYAQEEIVVKQEGKQMSLGIHNAFVVDIPQAVLKDVGNAWKKYIKRGETASSVEKKDNEYSLRGTVLTNITPKPLTVYTTFKETEKGIRLTAFFMEEDSSFISGEQEKAKSTEKMMADFARAQYHVAVEAEVKTETQKLSDQENTLEHLIKANEKSNNTISEKERKIDGTKKDIETNDHAASKRREEVANQKEVVRSVTHGSEAEDTENKKLSKLEKEFKKLEKNGESLHKDIDDYNSDIRQEKRDIEKRNEKIKEQEKAIDKQKDHLKDVKEKLEKIK